MNLLLLVLTCYFLFPTAWTLDALNDSVVNNTTDVDLPPKIVDADNSNFNASTESSLPGSTILPLNVSSTTTTTTASTTTTPDTTTTTVKPTTKTTKRPSSNNRRVCSCDLHIKSCDMNCCCDLDCNDMERKVFQFCINSEYYKPQIGAHHSHNSHSCFRSQIFYRENSPYHIEEASGGMFCVVTDNVGHVDQLEQEPKNVNLKVLTKTKLTFSWDTMRKIKDVSWEPYKYGSYLLQLKNIPGLGKNISPFGLPSSFYSKQCSATEYIKFLQPIRTRCNVQISNLKSSCTGNPQLNINTFVKNAGFIANPSSVNITRIPLILGLCSSFSNGTRLCHQISSFTEPIWKEDTSTCHNILESLELTFIHSGIEGLSKAVARGQLADYNLTFPPREIIQEFSTNFFWRTSVIEEPSGSEEESSNTTKIVEKENQLLLDDKDVHPLDWPRSGNPGYIVGKPIVMGVMILSEVEKEKESREQTDSNKKSGKHEVNKGEEGDGEESSENEPLSSDKGTPKPPEKLGISLDRDPKGWMTIHGPGVCSVDSNQRSNVLFGMGHQTECLLNVTNYNNCSDLQSEIVKILLGFSSDVEYVGRLHVAAFGNPDLDDLRDWELVGFLSLPTNLGKGASDNVNNNGCDQIVSTMKIKIAYAYVGPVSFPQAKIIAVLYEFGESFNVPKKLSCQNNEGDCLSYQHQVRVATAVSFIDATKAPTPKIGQWPVVSIKLPQDFFYPFATSNTSRFSLADIVFLFCSLSVSTNYV